MIIYDHGGKEWYQYGKKHRDNDQPAIIFANGIKWYYHDGERYHST